MSNRTYSDEVWGGFQWIWEPYRSERSRRLVVAVDRMLTNAFRDEKCKRIPPVQYRSLVRGSYRNRPDITQAFVSTVGYIATCFRCEQESRGLHLHILSNNTVDAYALVGRIEQRISTPGTKLALLDSLIDDLTMGRPRLALLSSIMAVVGSIGGILASLPIVTPIEDTIKAIFGIFLVMSMLYLSGFLGLLISQMYYAYRLMAL